MICAEAGCGVIPTVLPLTTMNDVVKPKLDLVHKFSWIGISWMACDSPGDQIPLNNELSKTVVSFNLKKKKK